MSATSTSPLHTAPSPWSRPGFKAANVTVWSARTASPGASPVSASTPEGMSMARTGAPAGGRGRVVAAAKSRPVGTVDDEIAGREECPAAGDGRVGLQDAYPCATPGQEAPLPPGRRRRCCPFRPPRRHGGRTRRRAGAAQHVRSRCRRASPGSRATRLRAQRRRPPAFRRGSGRRARGLLRDDKGDGHAFGMREGEVERARAPGAGQLGGRAVQPAGRARCGWRPSLRCGRPRRQSAGNRRYRRRAPS